MGMDMDMVCDAVCKAKPDTGLAFLASGERFFQPNVEGLIANANGLEYGVVDSLLIVLFLAPLAAHLPIPAMAGILFVVARGLVDLHHIREIVRTSRSETAVLAASRVATLTLDLEFAIYIGVRLSLMRYLNRA